MEQLLALSYGDGTTNTTVFPATGTGGTGLSPGGGVDPANAVAGYVDYLDPSGIILPATGGIPPGGWSYIRLWQISSPSPGLKRITVRVASAIKIGSLGRTPQSTLTTLKTFPF